jgi:hypothetical protein
MKRQLGSILSSRSKKIACTVSAAALMLGVSSAATIGLHFMENYCGSPAYSGYPVTLTAFGIESNGWENLYEMNTGYGSCSGPLGYTTNEVIDTETSTNGLNPLPNGLIGVTWFGPTANFDPFYGYAGSPPSYTGGGPLVNPKTGEQQVYATFIRDGLNFGPPGGADNDQPGYWVDVTNLQTLFTNTPFVVELMASADSMQLLTNAFVIDVANSITNSVSYPATPPVNNAGGAPWVRGNGGGLSTVSGVFSNVDEIYIMSNHPEHGTNATSEGFDNAGTICGFIMTDKPVVTMSPQSIPLSGPGDTNVLSAYAIGVPPLAYQWQFNGQDIPGATTLTNSFPSVLANSGSYTLVVTNLYGAATSQVAVVTVDSIVESPTATNNIVYDSNPDNPQHDGYNMGATWLASSTDSASVTRTGVMSFAAEETNGISFSDNTNFDGPSGTISFWMRSSGTDTNESGSYGYGAVLFERPVATNAGGGFVLLQDDLAQGNKLQLIGPNDIGNFTSSQSVSDGKWHFVALTFNNSTNGGAALYIDGAFDSTNSGNSGASFSWPVGQALDIGSGSDNYWRAYNGLLNDFRYYNTILSASEINSIYSSGALADTAALQLEYAFAAPPGEGLVLTWQEPSAVLQSAPAIDGPWAPVNGAISPYTLVPTESQQFFRYVSTNAPQTHISNPYLM